MDKYKDKGDEYWMNMKIKVMDIGLLWKSRLWILDEYEDQGDGYWMNIKIWILDYYEDQGDGY